VKKFKILIVDDDIYSLENIKLSLNNPNYYIKTAIDLKDTMDLIDDYEFDLLITDLKMPKMDGLQLAEYVLKNSFINNVILITGYGNEEVIEKALRIGIKDFLRKPYHESELINSVQKIYDNFLLQLENEELKKKLKAENKILKNQLLTSEKKYKIIGQNQKLLSQLKKALEVAKYSENAIILGESGTGKELLARYIHYNGPRKNKPFIAVNTASLSPSLFESELFGYCKGAFTNAIEDKPGLFELAEGGILFLDEISEIPLDLQAKLLRVIETKEVRRVGCNYWKHIDVQIIATTNRTEKELASNKILRKDLFYRLTSSTLKIPSLRKRKDDIPLLLEYYINEFNNQYEKSVQIPNGEIIKKLCEFDWPGNIRQLVNFVKNYVLFEPNIDDGDGNIDNWLSNEFNSPDAEDNLTFKFVKGTIDEIEQAKIWLIHKILVKNNYNILKTSKQLGMSYPGLHAFVKKHNLIKQKDDENY
jgi:two-component system response regulator PilR (NtrC family)